MIRHIVMFKLKDNSPRSLQKTKEVLLSMKDNVSLLRGIEVGVDFLHSERSFDVVLITDFDSKADLDLYQKDKYHVEVVKAYMHAAYETSVAIDYEY